MTTSAIAGAAALGLDDPGVVAVIQSMSRAHFYKLMTACTDHKSWQDVYHVPWDGKVIYLKFTADRLAEFRILSLKER